MNRDQKAAVVDEVAGQIQEADAIFAVDYRGISVQQAADLRHRLSEADATLRVVKNTLTELAADKAGAADLKALLEGPTAFTFVRGDAALAAKAIATFRREFDVPQFKGGTMGGDPLSVDEIESIAKLPAREVLHGQMVGVLASPVTGLVRGLNQLIAGLAQQLGQIAEQGLVGQSSVVSRQDEGADADADDGTPVEEAPAGDSGNAPTEGEQPSEELSGDPPEENTETETPSEGGDENEEG
jgi:large subunit ribosomal protein L10